jgi:hypothetical protein
LGVANDLGAYVELGTYVCVAAERSLACLRLLVEEGGAAVGGHHARAVSHAACAGRLDCLAYLCERGDCCCTGCNGCNGCTGCNGCNTCEAASGACWHAVGCGHLACVRYACERMRWPGRVAGRAATWVPGFAASCCVAASWCLGEADARRGVLCLRYVVAASGVSSLEVAAACAVACAARVDRDPWRAWRVCVRMHARATALKRAWRTRRDAERSRAAGAIADAWLRHHYAPRGRGSAAAQRRFERGAGVNK